MNWGPIVRRHDELEGVCLTVPPCARERNAAAPTESLNNRPFPAFDPRSVRALDAESRYTAHREHVLPPMPDAFTPVASLEDIPDPGTLSVRLPTGEQVCLIRVGDQVTALHDECTHQGMPLSAGEVMDDGSIECPFHGARFDISTGMVRRGPAEDDVRTWPVRVLDGRVFVAIESRNA